MKGCENIPVIMLTSNADKKMVLESSKLKIYDYVLKPFKKQDLCERIYTVLKKVSEEKAPGNSGNHGRSLLDMEKENSR